MHEVNGKGSDGRTAWKGVVAGMAGGLVASWAMNQFQAGLSSVTQALADSGRHQDEQQQQDEGRSETPSGGEDATTKTADTIAGAVLHRRLSRSEKQAAGTIVHYAFGSTLGAVYGAAVGLAPGTSLGWGLPFGAAVWLGADELAVPAFGLSKPPTAYPVSTHASALAAHFVYGVTTDLVRRAIRAVL